MLQRVFTGWTLTRVLYLLIGAAIMVSSLMDGEWIGTVLGGYFAAMGLFAFGCAGGHCHGTSSCSVEEKNSEHKVKGLEENLK